MSSARDNDANTSDMLPGNNSGQSLGQRQHSGNGSQGRGSRNCSRNNSKFKGKCEDLEGFIYDIGAPNSAQDLFTTTTREIAEYVAREYQNASKFGTGLPNLQLPTLLPPARPADGNQAAIKEYQLDLKEYKEKVCNRATNTGKVFS